MWGQQPETTLSKKVIEKFSSSRGDMMAVEDSKDEGGVDEVRYNHYMGCQSLNHGKTLPDPSMALIPNEMKEENDTFLF